MTLHPDNVKMLLSSDDRRYRLYAGFSGWAPRQLESEFDREGWFVLPADADSVFRADTAGLWEELVERVRALKTRTPGGPYAGDRTKTGP
jgi:putative transcriptional regulator